MTMYPWLMPPMRMSVPGTLRIVTLACSLSIVTLAGSLYSCIGGTPLPCHISTLAAALTRMAHHTQGAGANYLASCIVQ